MWHSLYQKYCTQGQGCARNIPCVYRLVSHNNITLADFQPHLIKFPAKTFPDRCLASGVSVFDSYSSIQHLRRRIPAFKKKLIAEGKININDGKTDIKYNSSHITWWIFIKSPQHQFRVIP